MWTRIKTISIKASDICSRKKHEGLISLTLYRIKSRRPRGHRLHTRYPAVKGLNPLEYFARYYLDRRRSHVSEKRYFQDIISASALLFLVIPLNGRPFNRGLAHIYFPYPPTDPGARLNLRNYSTLLACNADVTLFINRPTRAVWQHPG